MMRRPPESPLFPYPTLFRSSPTRLAVGHYWGFSLYELTEAGAKRVRLYTGHHGEVSAIAPSHDGTMVVTASPDQTIAAWSLRSEEHTSELQSRQYLVCRLLL